MAEYIDANKKVTIQVYDDMTEEWHEEKVTIAEALDKWTDEGCPRPVVIPVKHGRWIDRGNGQECSVCGEIQYGYDSYRNYCACCGADMREVSNG